MQSVTGRQTDARLAGLLRRGWRPRSGPSGREECFPCLLKPDAMLAGVFQGFLAVPDKALAIERREDVPI